MRVKKRRENGLSFLEQQFRLYTDHINHQIYTKDNIEDCSHQDGNEPRDHHCLIVLFFQRKRGRKKKEEGRKRKKKKEGMSYD